MKPSTLKRLGTSKNEPLGQFITAMTKINNNDGKKIKTMSWAYGVDEYKETSPKLENAQHVAYQASI